MIGTASLFGNTAKGIFGLISNWMDAGSRGLLSVAGDADYIERREQEKKPDNIIKGVAYGLKSTAFGVASGVVGIYQ